MAGGIDALIQAVPIALTMALLLTLLALLLHARRLARHYRAERAARPAAAAHGMSGTARAASPTEASAVAPAPNAVAGSPVAAASAQIARAEAAGDKAKLAELHLELARLHLASGGRVEAAAELRKSIMSAARLRQHGTHASARLLLGDLAERDGDLTTACEHWQIARTLFQELKMTDQLGSAEARMRRIGCPTDWVLNDF
jgi:hypothetical protein